jgi:hypothetical protein
MLTVVVVWVMRSIKYVQAAVQNVQEYLKGNGDRKLKKNASASFEATYRAEIDESLVLGPKWKTNSSPRLGFCAGVWNWAGLTSSLKCQCSPTFCVCRVKATWMLCITCLHTCPCTTMQGWCLTLLILKLICVLSSRPIGSPCMGTSMRQFLQMHLSQEENQSISVSLWILTMQESTSRAARGQVLSFI